MSQTLQKIDFADLTTILANINANFAIIENSPMFKGIPGKPGDEGDPGIRGPRGSIFILASLSNFTQFANLSDPTNPYNILVTQGISAFNINLINFLLNGDTQAIPPVLPDPNIYQALGLDLGESIMNGDLLILESDMQVYKFNMLTMQFIPQGIVLSNDLNIFQTINTLVQNTITATLASIQAQLSNLTLIDYGSMGSRFGYGTLTPDPFIENVTTYFPNLQGLNQATTNLGVGSGINREFKHIYFGLSDNLTSDLPIQVQDSYINTTTILGSVREYIRKLQMAGSNGTMLNANVNPTSEKLPALVVMQNDYNTGILLGAANHTLEPTLANYASIYKDADGNLVLKSRFDNTTTLQNSRLMLSRSLMVWEASANIMGNLTIGNNITSQYLNSFNVPASNPLINFLRVGFYDNNVNPRQNSTLEFYADNFLFRSVNDVLNDRILNINPNGFLSGEKYYDRYPNLTGNWNNFSFYNSFLQYYVNTANDPDKINKVSNNFHIKRLIEAIFGPNVTDFTGKNLDNVWYKPEYYQLPTGSILPNPLIPRLHLHEIFTISRNIGVNWWSVPLDVRTATGSYQYDTITIGGMGGSVTVIAGGNMNQNLSMTNIDMNYNNWIIRALHNRNVLTINENREVDSSFEYAHLDQTDVNNVLNDDITGFNPTGTDIRQRFSKYADANWQANTTASNNPVRNGLGQDLDPNTIDTDRGRRFLTGRHYRIIMGLFDNIFTWVKNNFVKKTDFEYDSNSLVPNGTVINYFPMTNIGASGLSNLQSKTFSIPNGWVPCFGGFIFKVRISNNTIAEKYNVPDLRNKLVYGCDGTASEGSSIDLNQLSNNTAVTTILNRIFTYNVSPNTANSINLIMNKVGETTLSPITATGTAILPNHRHVSRLRYFKSANTSDDNNLGNTWYAAIRTSGNGIIIPNAVSNSATTYNDPDTSGGPNPNRFISMLSSNPVQNISGDLATVGISLSTSTQTLNTINFLVPSVKLIPLLKYTLSSSERNTFVLYYAPEDSIPTNANDRHAFSPFNNPQNSPIWEIYPFRDITRTHV